MNKNLLNLCSYQKKESHPNEFWAVALFDNKKSRPHITKFLFSESIDPIAPAYERYRVEVIDTMDGSFMNSGVGAVSYVGSEWFDAREIVTHKSTDWNLFEQKNSSLKDIRKNSEFISHSEFQDNSYYDRIIKQSLFFKKPILINGVGEFKGLTEDLHLLPVEKTRFCTSMFNLDKAQIKEVEEATKSTKTPKLKKPRKGNRYPSP
jgi:hypothetical protein